MADSVDIYCIGKTADFDFTTFASNVVHPLALSVTNVADMANQVVLKCKSTKLGELTLVGHGNAFGQDIGTDWVDNKTLESFRTSLKRLVPLFGSDGLVTMEAASRARTAAFFSLFPTCSMFRYAASRLISEPSIPVTRAPKPGAI